MCKIRVLSLDKLDPRCREFVYLLNKYHFKTKYSCEGHMDDQYNKSFFIMFEDDIDDKSIDKLLMILGTCGEFTKWKRLVTEYGKPRILTNWLYTINLGTAKENQIYANVMCRRFKKYFGEKYKRVRYNLLI